MRGVHRLAPTDLAVLWPEDLGWPQDVGLLAILDAANGLDVERLRAHIATRIGALPPRFRKILVRPGRGLGRPYWVDAGALDLEYHVRAVSLPAGAGEGELLEACEQVRVERFDAARPRWHLTLMEGLADGRIGLLMDVHHCLVDGMSGVLALGAFVDTDVAVTVPPPPPPRRAPTATDLLLDVGAGVFRGLGSVATALFHLTKTCAQLLGDVRTMRRNTQLGPTPSTSLNVALGPRRRYALIRADLGQCKAVAHAHNATVNDVLLSAYAGGLRALLTARGESVDGWLLRAAVPVALRNEADPDGGNSVGGVMLPLPVGEPDPVRRLRRVAQESAERKQNAVMGGATSPLFRVGFLQRLVIRLAAHQRLSNSYVANVPGPPVALSMAGAPILEAFPIVPLLGNLTVGLGALSYAGQFGLTVVADADACPDLDILVTAMERDLKRFGQTLPDRRPSVFSASATMRSINSATEGRSSSSPTT